MSHNPHGSSSNNPNTGAARNAPTTPTPAATPPGKAPQPTSGRENSGVMYFIIGAAVLTLLVVLGFNLLGPQGASRTGVGDGPAQSHSPTLGGPTPGAARDDAANSSGTGNPSDSTSGSAAGTVTTTTTAAPQAPDSPSAPGREGVGAPVGGALQAGQSGPGGSAPGSTGADAPGGFAPAPQGVSPDAPAALPASPASPASR